MYRLSIIRCPSGRYSFVGSIPASLGEEVPASRADVMGQRAYKNAAGSIVTVRFPVFNTPEEAQTHARNHGHDAVIA